MLYVATMIDRSGVGELRDGARPAHRAYGERFQSRYERAGTIRSATGEVRGTIIFVEADSEDEVRKIVADDPYSKVGLFSTVVIGEYHASIQDGVRTN